MLFSCSDLLNESPSGFVESFIFLLVIGHIFTKFVQHLKDLICKIVQVLSEVKGKQNGITRG